MKGETSYRRSIYDRSGKPFTMLATIWSCSISCLVLPCRSGEGAAGPFPEETFFEGTGFETGAGAGFGGGAGVVSKNEKSTDAHGSVLRVAGGIVAFPGPLTGLENMLGDVAVTLFDGNGSDLDNVGHLGLGTSISWTLIVGLWPRLNEGSMACESVTDA